MFLAGCSGTGITTAGINLIGYWTATTITTPSSTMHKNNLTKLKFILYNKNKVKNRNHFYDIER
jgi:hypothetical protein